MLNKTWAFALALALAAAPVSSLLAAGQGVPVQAVPVQGVRRSGAGCRDPQRRECDRRNGCCKCQYTGGEDGPRRGEAFFAQCRRPRGKQTTSKPNLAGRGAPHALLPRQG